MTDFAYQKELARLLLADDLESDSVGAELVAAEITPAEVRNLVFPADRKPTPQPLPALPDVNGPLPKTDVLVITWTVDELKALCDVLTPGFMRSQWYNYRRNFTEKFVPQIRDGAPSRKAGRLGSWFPTRIGNKRVICFKSELHLNQDGKPTGDGRATLPVKDLFIQLIQEAKPDLVITVGTAGGTFLEHDLGDVVVTRGAKFRLQDEFRNEPFKSAAFRSNWQVPLTHFDKATELMKVTKPFLAEPKGVVPTQRYDLKTPLPVNDPSISVDGRDMPEFHPILSTDFFEFGTSTNRLDRDGCALEMGDAVLGLAVKELATPPNWLVIRNLSDPQINGDLPSGPGREQNLQAAWAVYYYRRYGYWTSVNSALTTWAVIAGL